MDDVFANSIGSHAPAFTRAQRRAIFAAALGTIVETTDWIIYATFAPFFAQHFFPGSDPKVSLLSTFAIFALGFVMRPIGGACIGAFADRMGRKKALLLSVALMAGSSVVIALCPDYATIGFAAPVVLVLARLSQGFAAGGDFGSASTFLIESSAPARRGLAGSWQYFSIYAGVLLAAAFGSVLTALLPLGVMETWGWRLAFGIAGLLAFVALFVRAKVVETTAFGKSAHGGHTENPFRALFRDHKKAAMRVVGISMAGSLCVYLWLVVFPTLAHLRAGMSMKDGFTASVISIVISLIAVPYIGMLSDKIGRRPVLLMFSIGSALYAWPALHLLSNNILAATVIATIGMLLASGFAATAATVMAEQFPASVRATGVALPYALSVALFGGTLPYIVTAVTKYGLDEYLWVYVTVICVAGTFIYAGMPETRGKVLD